MENYEFSVTQKCFIIFFIILVSFALDLLCKRILAPLARKIALRTDAKWDDYLLNDDVLSKFCHLVPPVAAYVLMSFAFSREQALLDIVFKVCWIYIVVVAVRLVFAILDSVYTISNEHEEYKHRSLKGFYQMLKLLGACIAVIIIVSELIGKSPIVILTGLGAGTAILMLVFQDTIKGLVAGIQLTANDMLRPGDWITVPKYGADGDVMEVTLTTVKVRNWDKTITTVPPYALVNDSFQNWRGMFEIGGRRVKRSVNIDMSSVRFLTAQEWKQFSKEPWMEGYEHAEGEVVNLSLYRQYITHYLKHHPKVHQGMLILVRQLQPTPQGLPIELYFFSADTAWIRYEGLQAEVFDHVLAVTHRFGLSVFQSPSGMDLQQRFRG
jgi:miniconductance mechanosensitive channel